MSSFEETLGKSGRADERRRRLNVAEGQAATVTRKMPARQASGLRRSRATDRHRDAEDVRTTGWSEVIRA